ncbi:cytochrome P450 [Dentipellis sp. KUC8613]|nr:cytochrome P450 [Dentipellis sp. KUC8613]
MSLPTAVDRPRNLDTKSLIVISVLSVFVVRYIQAQRPFYQVPPGPRGLPIVGNLFQLRGDLLSVFKKWQRAFGDLVYLNIAGQPMLIVNSGRIAADLFDRRSANYSERPRMIVGSEILSGGLFYPIRMRDSVWRRMRRATHEAMTNRVSRKYFSMQTTEAVLLTMNLLEAPMQWDKYLRRNAASLIMTVVYDHSPIQSDSDLSVRDVNDYANQLGAAMRPGAHLVEFFPSMMNIPDCFCKWKRDAKYWFERYTLVFKNLVDDVAKRTENGNIRPCITTALINKASVYNLSEKEVAWTAGTLYVAGSDTTATRRAQNELDTVIGHSRIPTFADFDHLPYIQAVVKECVRWKAILPFGVPHCALQDDWYDGMFIPKGTICIANIQAMNHDPRIFGSDAAQFNPDRYLDATGAMKAASSDDHHTFGFGRRICVGRHVANNTLFINAAVLLWAANITRVKDDVEPLDTEGFVDSGTPSYTVQLRDRAEISGGIEHSLSGKGAPFAMRQEYSISVVLYQCIVIVVAVWSGELEGGMNYDPHRDVTTEMSQNDGAHHHAVGVAPITLTTQHGPSQPGSGVSIIHGVLSRLQGPSSGQLMASRRNVHARTIGYPQNQRASLEPRTHAFRQNCGIWRESSAADIELYIRMLS